MGPANNQQIFSTILEQVYNQIKNDILSGVYGPGYHLQEKELAARHGVSRSPIREALKQLSIEGLTNSLPHKGVIVKSLSETEICEIFEMRAVLERAALKRAIERITDTEIARLNLICSDLTKYHKEKDLTKYIEADTALHDYIMYLWGNQSIYKIWKNNFAIIQPFRLASLQDIKRFNQSIEEHLAIVKGLCDKNFELAWHWDEIHLTLARDTILEKVKNYILKK